MNQISSAWQFVLDNPEISIFIVTTLAAGGAWLFRFSRRKWNNKKHREGSDPSDENLIWFVNVGEKQGHLLWEDCVRYGCISAGGGAQYRDALLKLQPEDIVYAYVSGEGYVGYGNVLEEAVPIVDFTIGETSILENTLETIGLERNKDDLDLSEYVVRIKWLKTYSRNQARWRTGKDLFFYRGTLCQLTDKKTLRFLQSEFGWLKRFES